MASSDVVPTAAPSFALFNSANVVAFAILLPLKETIACGAV